MLSKFKVLKILTLTAVMRPGKLRNLKRYWFINPIGILYLITIIYMTYNLVSQMREHLTDDEPGFGPRGDKEKNRKKEETENFLQPPPPPEGFDNDTSTGRQVAYITITSSEILYIVVTLVLRLFILANFPTIVDIFQSMMLREFCPLSYKWTRDELLVVLLLILSLCTQVAQNIQNSYERQLFCRCSYTRLLLEALETGIDCFISKSFPTECITFVLVIFTSVVSHNLQELGTYLDEDDETPGISKVGLDSLLEFEFPQEFRLHYNGQHASKHAITKRNMNPGQEVAVEDNQIFFVASKTPANNKKGSKEPERLLTDVNCLLRRYFDWHKLWKESELITGFLALVCFLSTTVNLCIYAFTTISSFMDFGIESRFFYSGFRTIFSVTYLFCLCNTAQFLLDVTEDLEEKLIMESWKETSFFRSDFSEALKEKQISYLLHHMSQNPINLSALGFFTASRSTLTSIGGVIVTYLVVLIQFRTSS